MFIVFIVTVQFVPLLYFSNDEPHLKYEIYTLFSVRHEFQFFILSQILLEILVSQDL